MNFVNTLSKSQMTQFNLDWTESENVLKWYYDFGHSTFDTDNPKFKGRVDTISILQAEEEPVVVFRIYLDGRVNKEMQNTYSSVVEVMNMPDDNLTEDEK